MAAQIPVKAIYSGSDVTSLGEFASSDSITATYLPVGTGSSDVAAGDHTHAYLPLAGGTLTGNLVTTGLIDGRDVAADGVLATNAMPKSGGAFTGAITTNSTIDTVDIATRDGVLTTTTTTANAALPKAGGTMTGNIAHAGAFSLNIGGDITLDSATDIILDAGTQAIILKDDGTQFGKIANASTHIAIYDGTTLNSTYSGSDITFAGVAAAVTFEPTGDTSSGDNAAIGYTSAEGLILTGQGSTSDITIKNDADADVLTVPTGTGKVLITSAAATGTSTGSANNSTETIDLNSKQNHVLTLGTNITLNVSNETIGQSGFIAFKQDGTGGRTVALHGDFETAGAAGLTLTATAGATDLVPYVVIAASRVLLGTPQLAFA
jgi:hypothetical protein